MAWERVVVSGLGVLGMGCVRLAHLCAPKLFMELLVPSVKRFLLTPFSCAFNPTARERWRLTVTNSTLRKGEGEHQSLDVGRAHRHAHGCASAFHCRRPQRERNPGYRLLQPEFFIDRGRNPRDLYLRTKV